MAQINTSSTDTQTTGQSISLLQTDLVSNKYN